MDLTPITDFFSNIKEKITNPFFGTLILVTISRNWDLIYSLFNFDTDTTLHYKLRYISTYLAEKNFLIEILINIGFTALIVVAGYFIVVLFRTLSIWIEFTVMPNLTKLAVSKKVVLKEEYDALKVDRDDYAERYEEQRLNVRNYSKDNDVLISRDQEQSKRIIELIEERDSLEKKNDAEKVARTEEFTSKLNILTNKIEEQRLQHIEEIQDAIENCKREKEPLHELIKDMRTTIGTMETEFSNEKLRLSEDWKIQRQMLLDDCEFENSELKNRNEILLKELEHFDFITEENSRLKFQLEECRQNKKIN